MGRFNTIHKRVEVADAQILILIGVVIGFLMGLLLAGMLVVQALK